jgi:hypothetical protein
MGYKWRTPFWAITIIAFDTEEKAAELKGLLRGGVTTKSCARRVGGRARCVSATRKPLSRSTPSFGGLSTSIIRDGRRVYRRERSDCSTHGLPRSIAAEVIRAKAPAIDTDKAREMVDAMLTWVIARHASWFWTGLQGERTINWLWSA